MCRLCDDLKKAKDAVIWLVAHGEGLIDFKGLVYWAGEVERLRDEIKV
jgi:hypothetical protein